MLPCFILQNCQNSMQSSSFVIKIDFLCLQSTLSRWMHRYLDPQNSCDGVRRRSSRHSYAQNINHSVMMCCTKGKAVCPNECRACILCKLTQYHRPIECYKYKHDLRRPQRGRVYHVHQPNTRHGKGSTIKHC